MSLRRCFRFGLKWAGVHLAFDFNCWGIFFSTQKTSVVFYSKVSSRLETDLCRLFSFSVIHTVIYGKIDCKKGSTSNNTQRTNLILDQCILYKKVHHVWFYNCFYSIRQLVSLSNHQKNGYSHPNYMYCMLKMEKKPLHPKCLHSSC